MPYAKRTARCKHCGKLFESTKKVPKYCSHGCYAASRCLPPERIWDSVDMSAGPDGCWPWNGTRTKAGYGQISVNGSALYTHRLAVELGGTAIPDGHEVMHTCDNPPCCNPAHLRVGPHADNAADMVRKERQGRGEAHSQAKLTRAEVVAIRRAAADGEDFDDIAVRYNVSSWTIYAIHRRLRWTHI